MDVHQSEWANPLDRALTAILSSLLTSRPTNTTQVYAPPSNSHQDIDVTPSDSHQDIDVTPSDRHQDIYALPSDSLQDIDDGDQPYNVVS